MKTILSQAPFTRIAWTGGSRPPKPSECSRDFCGVQKALFGEQVEYWRAAWHNEPSWDTLAAKPHAR